MSAPLFGIPQNNAHDFIPSREADFLAWSRNFRDQIVADPTQFGLTIAQAAQYSALHDAFAALRAIVINPATNSTSNVAAKNNAKAALKAEARVLARIVRAMPSVTSSQRIELGLTVPDEHLTPVAVSDDTPVLKVVETMGRAVRLRIRANSTTSRRARPAGTVGAVVLNYVAAANSPEEIAPPQALSKWSFCGLATRPKFQVNFAAEVPAGSKVWFIACWVNTRGKSGPFSAATSTRIGDGVAGLMGTLRLAA